MDREKKKQWLQQCIRLKVNCFWMQTNLGESMLILNAAAAAKLS